MKRNPKVQVVLGGMLLLVFTNCLLCLCSSDRPIFMYVCMCVWVCVCIYVIVYVCMYLSR